MSGFFMKDRIELFFCATSLELGQVIHSEMLELGATLFPLPGANNAPLTACVKAVTAFGGTSVLVQRRVFDADFSAEYSVYYGQQFNNVPRTCTRLHFFHETSVAGESSVHFLDRVPEGTYLGFVTLRPVPRAPVAATILAARVAAPHIVCSRDRFPVHIAGKSFDIDGTPFMQQDNAVAVCAQASIWMALRTLRRREGDRAHNPAQITDAATRYLISDRTRPNKGGLTIQQIAEAVRAAGYSPLSMRLSQSNPAQPQECKLMREKLHPYIESDIPVLLALSAPSGGHAVAVIGHTWEAAPQGADKIPVMWKGAAFDMDFCHAATWAPDFIIHNDNSGPYRVLPSVDCSPKYCLPQAFHAIPLLPADVFMTAEEAMICGVKALGGTLEVLGKRKSPGEIKAIAGALVLRLLLADKSRIRQWAVAESMPSTLSLWLRTKDLPRRVWVLEVHKEANFGASHSNAPQPTLIGLFLIDPTGDALDANKNILLSFLNFPAIAGVGFGVVFHKSQSALERTEHHGPIQKLRRAT
ncbi:hypothetical protein [Xanthomonas arboricola]|uniref:hypothetical protein n=1 Tax=Xanthomonas arboricola TaxID=56448 RepID=UPI0012D32661|nr:hypothetical protein [Xanthomonas arboricola]